MMKAHRQDEATAWRPLAQSFREEAATHAQAILLETSRLCPGARSYLFLDPFEVLQPSTFAGLLEMFKRMDAETARGHWVAELMPEVRYQGTTHTKEGRNNSS